MQNLRESLKWKLCYLEDVETDVEKDVDTEVLTLSPSLTFSDKNSFNKSNINYEITKSSMRHFHTEHTYPFHVRQLMTKNLVLSLHPKKRATAVSHCIVSFFMYYLKCSNIWVPSNLYSLPSLNIQCTYPVCASAMQRAGITHSATKDA